MARKLLVITAGTVAAAVGAEFLKQVQEHPGSDLVPLVRYLDTAHLPTHYPWILDGDWTQLTIGSQIIDAVRRDPDDFPELKEMLYPDLLPQIKGSGGGSIRYNAAGAVIINRGKIKNWLKRSITQLVSRDKGQADLSVALVVSAVGATGSGSIEYLIDMIVDAAQDSQIPEPLHCDVFILQPGMSGVTTLGLANTLALYAEMAASRISQKATSSKSYRGRTIMVGWGSRIVLASMNQLVEAAATLVRLANDPGTEIAAEYQEREVDNHVLRQVDNKTKLPSHISSATAVTISLGDLEKKIIERDAARLVDTLVFGGIAQETLSGEYTVVNVTSRPPNVLLSALSSFLSGESPEASYRLLCRRLAEATRARSLQITVGQLASTSPNVREQASTLQSMWGSDKADMAQTGRKEIQKMGASLAAQAINTMLSTRFERMSTDLSLKQLRDDYVSIENLLASVGKAAEEAMQRGSQQGFQSNASEELVVKARIDALARAHRFNKQTLAEQALGAVQNDLRQSLRQEIAPIAAEVLKELERHVKTSLVNLNVVLQKLNKERKNNPIWTLSDKPLEIKIDHPLHLTALAHDEEIKRYASKVSIFDAASRRKSTSIGLLMEGQETETDPIVDFRVWMGKENRLEALFRGDVNQLLENALAYAQDYIHTEVKKHSVIEIMLESGEGVLVQRLKDAADAAHPLVKFSEQFTDDNDLRQARHVGAYYEKDEQRSALVSAISKAFGQGNCTLVKSNDRTEIVVFYYVDGLSISAIDDLSGRCLNSFLKLRQDWHHRKKSQQGNGGTASGYNEKVGVPIYNGLDAENRVLETGIIRNLYKYRKQNVDEFKPGDIPELM